MNDSSDSLPDCGVLYVALGSRYLEEARKSATSLRATNTGIGVAVITDQEVPLDGTFDKVLSFETGFAAQNEKYLARDRAAYYRKILPLLCSPFERTVFLDSDTWVNGSLAGAFRLLKDFDVLVTPVFIIADYAFEEREMPFAAIPDTFGYFNSGFFGFRRSEAVERFIHRWQENYETQTSRFTVNDQPALRLTLFEGGVRFHVLPPQYNTVSWAPFLIPPGGRVIVLHGRNQWLQRWAGHLTTMRPVMVGGFSFKHLALYQTARLLCAIERLWNKLTNRSGK